MKTRRKPKGLRIRLVAAVFFLLAGGVLYTGDRMLMWGALCCLSLLLGTALWHLVAGAAMNVQAYADVQDPVKGQRMSMMLSVHNRTPFPVLWMEMTCLTIDAPFAGIEPTITLSLPPFGRRTFSMEMTCLYRGGYDIGVTGLKLQDPLGFLSLGHRVHGHPVDRVSVWPRRVKVPGTEDSQAVLEEKTIPRRDYTEDLSSIHDIRDWHDGDAMKRVHWKLTARMGTLMVKEFDSTQRDEISVILDARPGSAEPLDRIRYEDALIESTYSICAYLLEHGHPLRLTTHTDEIIHMRGSDTADIPRFFSFLAFMPVSGVHSAEEILAFETPMLSRGGRLVVIGAKPEESLFAGLTSLADSGIDITLVLAVPRSIPRPVSEADARKLEEAGIVCILADPDLGLSLVEPASAVPAPAGVAR